MRDKDVARGTSHFYCPSNRKTADSILFRTKEAGRNFRPLLFGYSGDGADAIAFSRQETGTGKEGKSQIKFAKLTPSEIANTSLARAVEQNA